MSGYNASKSNDCNDYEISHETVGQYSERSTDRECIWS